MEELKQIQENLRSVKAFVLPVNTIKPVREDLFMISGQRVAVSATAFKDLLNLVGLTRKTVDHLNDVIAEDAGFSLMAHLIKALTEKQGLIIKALINVDTKEIVRISANNGSDVTISPETFQSLMGYLTDNDNITVKDVSVTDSGTKTSITLLWDKDIPLAMKGEDISYGSRLTWDMFGDIDITELVERLKCRNGMTHFIESGTHRHLTPESSPTEWYNYIVKTIKEPDPKVIKEYESNVFKAIQTNMSVNEYNVIRAHALEVYKDDAPIITKYLGDERWASEYEKRGIDLTKLSKEQLKNCPTPVNKWDGINLLTDLASHEYVTKVGKTARILTQKLAGKLLKRRADEDAMVLNTPKFNRVKPQS